MLVLLLIIAFHRGNLSGITVDSCTLGHCGLGVILLLILGLFIRLLTLGRHARGIVFFGLDDFALLRVLGLLTFSLNAGVLRVLGPRDGLVCISWFVLLTLSVIFSGLNWLDISFLVALTSLTLWPLTLGRISLRIDTLTASSALWLDHAITHRHHGHALSHLPFLGRALNALMASISLALSGTLDVLLNLLFGGLRELARD